MQRAVSFGLGGDILICGLSVQPVYLPSKHGGLPVYTSSWGPYMKGQAVWTETADLAHV